MLLLSHHPSLLALVVTAAFIVIGWPLQQAGVLAGDDKFVTFINKGTKKIVSTGTAEADGKEPLVADREKPDVWENFCMIRTNKEPMEDSNNEKERDWISLRAKANDRWVTVDLGISADGPVVANRKKWDTWERFKMVWQQDGSCALQSNENRKWLSADNPGKKLFANKDQVQDFEKFYVDGGPFYLDSHGNKKIVSVNGDTSTGAALGALTADRDDVKEWELFQLLYNGDKTHSFLSLSTKKWVRVTSDNKLVANADVNHREKFRIVGLPQKDQPNGLPFVVYHVVLLQAMSSKNFLQRNRLTNELFVTGSVSGDISEFVTNKDKVDNLAQFYLRPYFKECGEAIPSGTAAGGQSQKPGAGGSTECPVQTPVQAATEEFVSFLSQRTKKFVSINTANGENNKEVLVADRDKADEWERFSMIGISDLISIRAKGNDRWVIADWDVAHEAPLIASRKDKTDGAYERFKMVWQRDGTCALRAENTKKETAWLSVDNPGMKLEADRQHVEISEKFYLDGGPFRFFSYMTEKYVNMHNGGYLYSLGVPEDGGARFRLMYNGDGSYSFMFFGTRRWVRLSGPNNKLVANACLDDRERFEIVGMPHKDLPNGRSYVTKYSSYVLLYARSNKSFVHRNVGETHELEATVRVENIDEFLKTKNGDGPDLNQVEYMFIRPYHYTS